MRPPTFCPSTPYFRRSTGNGAAPSLLRERRGLCGQDDTGAQIGTGGVVMSVNGHTSFVLSTQFPVTANRRGTVEFDDPGMQFSVLAGIPFTPPNNALTTIPALANVGTVGGSFAHFASGGDGWQTILSAGKHQEPPGRPPL